MEHLQKGMGKKLKQHYKETVSTVAIGLVLLGVSILFSLFLMWPQVLARVILNSKISFHAIISSDDIWTCNSDYRKFVYDEPSIDISLVSFYLFNVTNTQNVVARGYKPSLVEMGPYGYKKASYKSVSYTHLTLPTIYSV